MLYKCSMFAFELPQLTQVSKNLKPTHAIKNLGKYEVRS